MMKRFQLTPETIEQISGKLSEALLKEGTVLLLPTETVYGLVARAGDRKAEQRIFELKHRNAAKTLGWFIGNWRTLPEYGVKLDGWPEKLASAYCPGALTIIAPCNDGTTVGFRVPDTPLLARLLEKVSGPLIQTSANGSGMPDAGSCDEALAQLNGPVDYVVDGGAIEGKIAASTVVDATGENLKILRHGPVDLQKWL